MKETDQTLLDQIIDDVAKENHGYKHDRSLVNYSFWKIVCERYAEAKAKASCEAESAYKEFEKPDFESQSKTIYQTERRQKAFQEGCEHVWNTYVVPLLSDFESNQRSVYSLNGRCNQLDSENKALQEKLKIAEHLKELADDAIVTLQKEVEKLKADNESLLMFKLYLD